MTEDEAKALQKRLLQFISQMPDAPDSLVNCGSLDFVDQLMADPKLVVTVNDAITASLEAARPAAALKAKVAKLLRRGIPEILWPPIMGSVPFDESESISYVRKWWEHGDDWVLVLVGKNGPGKSQAAAWLIYEYLLAADAEFVPKFLTLDEQYTYSPYDDGADYLYKAPLLCIDEVGRVYPDRKEFLKTKLEMLILTRHAHRLPTILTSNLTCNEDDNQLAAYLGSAVWDRILEHTPPSIFEISEASRRSGR